MQDLALRPLTLGEILDRAFSLYRRYFLLFIGIAGIPQVITLAFNLFRTATQPPVEAGVPIQAGLSGLFSGTQLILTLVYLVVALVAYLFSQGGTILAVSDLYLGRQTSIAESLKKVWAEFGLMFGVVMLNGIAVGIGMIFLLIPGIYIGCRLLVCVPAALIEKRAPGSSLSRSFELTKGFAGRAFMIVALYVLVAGAAGLLIGLPFGIALQTANGNPEMVRFWTMISQVGGSLATMLISPIFLISTSIFYYDLRVRKEAFDLQFMMNPDAQKNPGATDVPSILS